MTIRQDMQIVKSAYPHAYCAKEEYYPGLLEQTRYIIADPQKGVIISYGISKSAAWSDAARFINAVMMTKLEL